jgi:hypothetical protein
MGLTKDGTDLYVGTDLGRIYRVSLITPNAVTLVTSAGAWADSSTVVGSDIYFMTMNPFSSFALYRAPKTGGPATLVTSGTPAASAFVLTGTNVFWLSYSGSPGTLWRRPLTGGPDVLVANLPSTGTFANGLISDGAGGFLATAQGDQHMFRIPASGGAVTLGPDLGSLFGGPIAEDNRYHYVAHYGANNVLRVEKTSGTVTVVASGAATKAPHGIAVDDTTVYWSNYTGNDIWAVAK